MTDSINMAGISFNTGLRLKQGFDPLDLTPPRRLTDAEVLVRIERLKTWAYIEAKKRQGRRNDLAGNPIVTGGSSLLLARFVGKSSSCVSKAKLVLTHEKTARLVRSGKIGLNQGYRQAMVALGRWKSSSVAIGLLVGRGPRMVDKAKAVLRYHGLAEKVLIGKLTLNQAYEHVRRKT